MRNNACTAYIGVYVRTYTYMTRNGRSKFRGAQTRACFFPILSFSFSLALACIILDRMKKLLLPRSLVFLSFKAKGWWCCFGSEEFSSSEGVGLGDSSK